MTDTSGNFILIAGTTLAVTGLAFAGVRFSWGSVQVLAPLVIGMALVFAFILYEAKFPKEPSIPWEILTNRTTLGGYAGTFIHGITSISIICKWKSVTSIELEMLIRTRRLYPRVLPGMPRSLAHSFRCGYARYCFARSAIRASGGCHSAITRKVRPSQLCRMGPINSRLWVVDYAASRFVNRCMGRVPDRCGYRHRNSSK